LFVVGEKTSSLQLKNRRIYMLYLYNK
jgi:hypothetical protein